MLVAAWAVGLAAALWPAVVVALAAWAVVVVARLSWGWLVGFALVAALPLALGADTTGLLKAAPAWKTSAAVDELGVGGWLEQRAA